MAKRYTDYSIEGVLNINNAFSFPIIDGLIDQVLTTDGSGNVTWQPSVGSDTNIANTDLLLDANHFTNLNTKVLTFKALAATDLLTLDASSAMGAVIKFGDVATNYTFPTARALLAGQILETNGSGVLAWVTPGGGGGCCSLQATMNIGSEAIGLGTDVRIETSGEIFFESTNSEINYEAADDIKLTSSGANVMIATSSTSPGGGDIILNSSGEVQILCNFEQEPKRRRLFSF